MALGPIAALHALAPHTAVWTVWLLPTGALLVRIVRVSLDFDGGGVTIRNVSRTKRLAWADLAAIDVAGGFLAAAHTTLRFETKEGVSVRATAAGAPSRHTAALAAVLRPAAEKKGVICNFGTPGRHRWFSTENAEWPIRSKRKGRRYPLGVRTERRREIDAARPKWPRKGDRLKSAALVACPLIGCVGLLLRMVEVIGWPVTVILEIPMLGSILYLMLFVKDDEPDS